MAESLYTAVTFNDTPCKSRDVIQWPGGSEWPNRCTPLSRSMTHPATVEM